jgi:hypothetical protein
MLADYLDGLASPEQRIATEEHLAECRSCRDHVVEIHSLVEKGQEETFTEPDNDTLERMLGLIRAKLGTPRVQCPACDEENARQSSMCSACGARLNPPPVVLACISCGKRLPDGSRFCPTCGAAIAPPAKTLGFLFARRRSVLELLRAYIWFLAGFSVIGISLVAHRFFIQLTALGLIFCMKGVLDQAKFRAYAEILKLLRKETESEEVTSKHISSNR